MENTGRRNSVRRPTQYRGTIQEERKHARLWNGWVKAITFGLVGTVIGLVLSILTTVFILAPSYSEQARLGENTPIQVALNIALWQFAVAIVEIIIVIFAGRKIGKATGWPLSGIITGGLMGALIEFGLLIVHLFPGYPEFIIYHGNTHPDFWQTLSGGFIPILAYAVIGAIIGLLSGSLFTARKYRNSREKREE